jgi:hypothetical protein
MGSELLMIFVKNPVAGKVKTRLAKTIGPEKAMEVYQHLIDHTRAVTESLPVDKAVFYSDEIDTTDAWTSSLFQKFDQEGSDLGKRMYNAFKLGFGKAYRKIVVIGSDTFDITSEIISESFQLLERNNFVLGPSHDGGYYLLGMSAMHAQLFRNKKWSSENVLHDTLVDIRNMNGSYHLLPELVDVDTEEDLLISQNKNALAFLTP